MAFDTSTRNRLNKFVSDARALLTDEFTNQFQQDYGMDPDTGEVADLERLSHLDDARRQTAVILRETLAHYYANLPSKQTKQESDYKQLIDRIIREQAFTVLNRICAIRMAEARELAIESIASGPQSKGFQLYQPVIGNSLGDTGAAYQQYLLSVFDEFAVELPVLFDRYSPQGRLFPRESVLTELLELINDPEVGQLWAEDETIGWVYQYFNSKEERKAMRDFSPAPRNSRELAVRNQFFTPRYVVEFLTDNTLGRIWYEMRKGETVLRDTCQYLVRRPNEIFLAEGEEPLIAEESDEGKDLTQEQLLNHPVHIPHRPLKDPREIRMLDPACGSMHFGLYAFDLYLKIYEEYWDLVISDPSVSIEHTDLRPLTECYESRDAFLRDVPRLIIEHNIHGIDIDPRAVQIAGLSLWLRAQRAWKSQGIAAANRPEITRSNVVCAEPMPGDQQQLESFCQELHPAIAQMVTAIFEEMKLAGEAGSLLKIEQEISALVAKAKKQYQDNPPDKKTQMQLFSGANVVKEQQLEFDLSGITDELFFEKTEDEIYAALRNFSETTEHDIAFRRKLFANDAEQGFAFIDVLSKPFDAVLMNPPFGETSLGAKKYLHKNYKDEKIDIYAMFMTRSLAICRGFVGCISSRSGFYVSKLQKWREKNFVTPRRSLVLADLGLGVLDALVETAAYIVRAVPTPGSVSQFFRVMSYLPEGKGSELRRRISDGGQTSCYFQQLDTFEGIPESRFAYWAPKKLLSLFTEFPELSNANCRTAQGLATTNDFRYVRIWAEIPVVELGKRWKTFAKGGEYSLYFGSNELVVNWFNEGQEIKADIVQKYDYLEGDWGWVAKNSDLYGSYGITFPERTGSGFSPRVMPNGTIFSVQGQFATADDESATLCLLAVLASRITAYLLELCVATADTSVSGSAARRYAGGLLSGFPVPESALSDSELAELVQLLVSHLQELRICETDRQFHLPAQESCLSFSDYIKHGVTARFKGSVEAYRILDQIEAKVAGHFGLAADEYAECCRELGGSPTQYNGTQAIDNLPELLALSESELVDRLAGSISAGRLAVKKTFLIQRDVELICHAYHLSPDALLAQIEEVSPSEGPICEELAERFLGICLGAAFERWKLSDSLTEIKTDVFQELDVPKHLNLDVGEAILVDDEGHSRDIVSKLCTNIGSIYSCADEQFILEAGQLLNPRLQSVREIIRKELFEHHLSQYSISRRNAPIYWPISTESGSYTLWIYYHRLTDQTLFLAVNEFIDPKIDDEVRPALRNLRAIKDRSSKQEKELAKLTELESELEQFKTDLLEIATFLKPNLNDGVQITAAPLWKFFRLTKWRNKLKKTWQELESGKFDWAHLALGIWPERIVREKCTTDRSIAIAHELEEQFWHEVEVTKVSKSGRETIKMEWQPRDLSEAELDAIVEAVKSGKQPPVPEPAS
ncbi:MAG: BREX-1 system adenine-specific DNA-methyltransferase PglX [Planctomycetota bacterium]